MRFDDAAFARFRALLATRPAIELAPGKFRRACVVAPFIRHDAGWSILFHRRSANLAKHSGQVAFPGGASLPTESLEEAALREMEEEIGVPRSRVEIIGRLDDLFTVSGYVVAPFVGVIPSGLQYVMQESEVVEVYEVPVDALMRPGNPEVRYIEYLRKSYPSYFYHHGDVEIWGLTGRMIKAILDLIWTCV